MLLDIVILPPAELREKIGKKIKEATKGMKTVFVVDNKKLIPHLSLFHIRTSKNRIRNLELRIREIMKKYQPFELKTLGFYWGGDAGRQWIGQDITNPKILIKLHKEIVAACHNLRTGMMPSTSKNLNKLEKYYRRKYGARHLLKFFRPHFTLAMVKKHKDLNNIIRRTRPEKMKFLADTIAIAEVNFWHQVMRVIKRFRFSTSPGLRPPSPGLGRGWGRGRT